MGQLNNLFVNKYLFPGIFILCFVVVFRRKFLFSDSLGACFSFGRFFRLFLLVTEFLEFDSIYIPPKLQKMLRNPYSIKKRKSLRKRNVKKEIISNIEVATKKCNSNKKPTQFSCQHCGKLYKWKSTMRRHERVECGGKEPTFQCEFCPYKAKQKGNLRVHARKHHEIKENEN